MQATLGNAQHELMEHMGSGAMLAMLEGIPSRHAIRDVATEKQILMAKNGNLLGELPNRLSI